MRGHPSVQKPRSNKPSKNGARTSAARGLLQIRRSADLLAAVVESAEIAVYTRATDGMVTTWNKGCERLYGYSEREALGRPASFLMPADRLNETAAAIERIRSGERVEEFETRRMHKDEIGRAHV